MTGNEKDRVREKFAPLNQPTTAFLSPNLQRVTVDRQNKYIAPTIQIKLKKQKDSIAESSTSSAISDFPYNEKIVQVSTDELYKTQRSLMILIQNVGDFNSIKGFKMFYQEHYILAGKLSKDLEFHSFLEKWSFLHEASKHGNTDIAKFLIFERMQDPNMVSDSLWTPLQLSWHHGHVKLTMLLWESPKLDPDIVTDYLRGSALEISKRNISDECINLIRNKKDSSFISDKHLNCFKVICKFKNITFNINDFAAAPLMKRSSSFHEKQIPQDTANYSSPLASQSKRKKARANSQFDGSSSNKVSESKQLWFEDIQKVWEKYLSHLQIKIPENFFDVLDQAYQKSKFNESFEDIPFMWEYEGFIGRSQTLGLKVAYRWFKLSSNAGSLIEYKTKEDCPNKPYRIIPLNTIGTVLPSTGRWMMKKALYYWEIDNKQIMWNKTIQCQNLWIDKIQQSIGYSWWIDALKNIRFTEVPIPAELQISENDKANIERFVDKILSTKLMKVEINDSDVNWGLIYEKEPNKYMSVESINLTNIKVSESKTNDAQITTSTHKLKNKISNKKVANVNINLTDDYNEKE